MIGKIKEMVLELGVEILKIRGGESI